MEISCLKTSFIRNGVDTEGEFLDGEEDEKIVTSVMKSDSSDNESRN